MKMASRDARLTSQILASSSILVVQAIGTVWTKRSRGAERAAFRRGVPEAVSLPPIAAMPGEPPCVWHEVCYEDADDFRVPHPRAIKLWRAGHTVSDLGFAFTVKGETLTVDFEGRHYAQPARRNVRGILNLQQGEWGRARYNYRTGGDEPWRYWHWVVNVGLWIALSPNMFLSSLPAKTYDNIVDLYHLRRS
jgi:hypothetical protein